MLKKQALVISSEAWRQYLTTLWRLVPMTWKTRGERVAAGFPWCCGFKLGPLETWCRGKPKADWRPHWWNWWWWLTRTLRRPSFHPLASCHEMYYKGRRFHNADAFIRLTVHELTKLAVKEWYELTAWTKYLLPPTYYEIAFFPHFTGSYGILIRKGSHKLRSKEVPKRKTFLTQLGDIHTLLL